MTPDFSIISGLDPKFSGLHNTRSASAPTATCPTMWLIPWVIALDSLHENTATPDVEADLRIDGILRDVSLDTRVIPTLDIAQQRQRAPELSHLARCSPCAADDFADASHSLRIRTNHRYGADVVQDIFGRHGLGANAGFGEGKIFGNGFVQMMTDHKHLKAKHQAGEETRCSDVLHPSVHPGCCWYTDAWGLLMREARYRGHIRRLCQVHGHHLWFVCRCLAMPVIMFKFLPAPSV